MGVEPAQPIRISPLLMADYGSPKRGQGVAARTGDMGGLLFRRDGQCRPIDATIVRIILVPAAMQLLGKWNWWFPEWLDRRVPRIDLAE